MELFEVEIKNDILGNSKFVMPLEKIARFNLVAKSLAVKSSEDGLEHRSGMWIVRPFHEPNVCFDEEIDGSEYGEVFTLEDFLKCGDAGYLTDYDGFGYPIKDGKQCSHVRIYPSERKYNIPEGTTHINWYNK